MSFQDIKRVEKAQTYLDIAVKRALKHNSPKKRGLAFEKARPREYDRIGIIGENLASKLGEIVKNYPILGEFPEFYHELLKVTVDYDKLKKSLSNVKWAANKIKELTREHKQRMARTNEFPQLDTVKKAYLGRVSSVIAQISLNLEYLEFARRTMKNFPVLKTGVFTVCIAGFPNVGKTTLLSKLTTSTPEINEYAFTTKQLNLGYADIKENKVQFIDTPGTLARPEKMNNIEKQAYLAIKYQAELIIYIFDLTEPYPLEDQKKLLGKIKSFDKPIIIYISKTDLLGQNEFTTFANEYKAITSIEELKREIGKRIK
ncbi:50S ribosome-binding GTPase [Candidatus Woesearchaeota archaeon]|nr:50S ribosome-binding GTPase [Candidatus Woesearchaeota archaeon]